MTAPRILLVMHNAPLESTFLTAKYKALSTEMDVHVLFWDTEEHTKQFIAKNDLAHVSQKIHRGISTPIRALANTLRFLLLLFTNGRVASYLFSGDGSIRYRMKLVMYYMPVFTIRPSVIHFEFGTLAKDIKILKQLSGAKTLVSFRGYDLNYIGLGNANYYDAVWEHTDAVHFLGQDLKQRAIERGYKNNKLEAIISPAVDTTLFNKQRLHSNAPVLNIISVGRLTWKKGYEYAVQAMAILKDNNVPFQYTIIGEGPHRQAIEFTIHELGLQDLVKVVGPKSIEDISTSLSGSDVFLHPALSEGFCNAVIEAQAAGIPVICTDADGLKENIEDEVTGVVVPKWNVAAIADKLLWANNSRQHLKQMGEAGKQRATEMYGLESQIKSFIDLYCKLHES